MQSTIELLNYTSDKGFIDQDDQHYLSSQWGASVHQIHRDGVDIREMDLIIIGCGERRGQNGKWKRRGREDAPEWAGGLRLAPFARPPRRWLNGRGQAQCRTMSRRAQVA